VLGWEEIASIENTIRRSRAGQCAGGLMASMCAAGHAIAGRKMFYRPIKSAILITIYFVLSAVTLFVLSFRGWGDAVAWLIATQFAGTPRSISSFRCGSVEL
jgi:hypothetical protein